MQQLDASFVALKLQLQNRSRKPGAIFSAICLRHIACLKLDAILAGQKLHRVAAKKNRLCKRALTQVAALYDNQTLVYGSRRVFVSVLRL